MSPESVAVHFPSFRGGVLPSTPSAAGHPSFVQSLHRYYYPVRLLAPSSTASPRRLPVAALPPEAALGGARLPGSDVLPLHDVALRPRQSDGTLHSGPAHIAFGTIDDLGHCNLAISWLNPTPCTIAVYASSWPSPNTTQHSLPSERYSLPGPDFHRLDHASFPGAPMLGLRFPVNASTTHSRAPPHDSVPPWEYPRNVSMTLRHPSSEQ